MSREGQKYCRGCQTWKPLDEFQNNSARRDGKQDRCKICSNAAAKAWREGNANYYHRRLARDPHYFRSAKLRKRYNMTLEQYAALERKQKGLCAICKQPEKRVIKGKLLPLVVDHDHVTGKVRGLLCHACNMALGLVERVDWLKRATAYLEKHR